MPFKRETEKSCEMSLVPKITFCNEAMSEDDEEDDRNEAIEFLVDSNVSFIKSFCLVLDLNTNVPFHNSRSRLILLVIKTKIMKTTFGLCKILPSETYWFI